MRDGIDAGMVVEAAVLDREDRLDHVRREWPRAARRGASRGRSGTSAVMSGAPSARSAVVAFVPTTSIRSMTAGSASFARFPPNTTRTCCSLRSPSRGTITRASRPIVNSPPAVGFGAVRVAEVVEAVDELVRASATGRGAARRDGRRRAGRPAAFRRECARRSSGRTGRSSSP